MKIIRQTNKFILNEKHYLELKYKEYVVYQIVYFLGIFKLQLKTYDFNSLSKKDNLNNIYMNFNIIKVNTKQI
jgi:hypothetical protein